MADGNGKNSKIKVKKLAESEFHLTEAVMASHVALPAEGTTREDVLNPVFWSHVAKGVRSPAMFHILPKDGAWYGRFLVVFCDALRIKLVELEYRVLDAITEAELVNDKYEVKWGGPVVRFRVIRKIDGLVMKENFQDKTAASAWMSTSLR